MNQLAGKLFELTKLGEDCFDAEKEPLDNVSECRMAAQKLRKNIKRYFKEGTWSHLPKGCDLWYDKDVFWNKHETGGKDSRAQAICKSGKYIHRYYVVVS